MISASERQRCLAVCGIALAVFTFLALQVSLRGPVLLNVDPAVTAWLAERRTHAMTLLLIGVTELHSTAGIDTMVVLVALFMGVRQRRGRDALWLLAAVQSSMLLNVVLKDAFARPRPEVALPLVHLSTFSFPSGHALASTAFWGCLVCLLPAGRRIGAGIGASLLVMAVCISRVYLGAHFLSDVVAGVCEGLFCVCAWRLALPLFLQRAHPSLSSADANLEGTVIPHSGLSMRGAASRGGALQRGDWPEGLSTKNESKP